MNGKEALEAYGFKLIGAEEGAPGAYIRVLGSTLELNTERWIPVEGGFECYKLSVGGPIQGEGFGGDYGPVDPATGIVKVAWRLNERFANASGLHPATHPECYDFVWPDEVVAFQYEYAGVGWRKETAEDGTVTMVRDKS